jgi:hypothetical protein
MGGTPRQHPLMADSGRLAFGCRQMPALTGREASFGSDPLQLGMIFPR